MYSRWFVLLQKGVDILQEYNFLVGLFQTLQFVNDIYVQAQQEIALDEIDQIVWRQRSTQAFEKIYPGWIVVFSRRFWKDNNSGINLRRQQILISFSISYPNGGSNWKS